MAMVNIGVSALDDLLVDGLPKGFTMLVCGSPGVGTELFAKQFAAAGLPRENVVYFSTLERAEDIISTMKHFGWKPDIKIVDIGTDYYNTVLARDIDISKYRQEGIALNDVKKFTAGATEKRSTNFLTLLTYEISQLKPPFRIVLDSLDFFLEHYEHKNVLSALRTLRFYTQHHESVALVTMLTNVYDLRTQSGVEEVVDCIVELEREREEKAFRNYLTVRKVRNHPEKTGIIAYRITKNGISTI